jgi:hypothetical protein
MKNGVMRSSESRVIQESSKNTHDWQAGQTGGGLLQLPRAICALDRTAPPHYVSFRNLVGCPAQAGLRGDPANPTNLIRVMPAEGDEMRSPSDIGAIARAAGDVLERLRAKSPRVHCITNSVAQNFTANVLLALGAQPSMTISAEEIGHFARSADALLVNLGTFDRDRDRRHGRATGQAAMGARSGPDRPIAASG